MKTFRPPRLLVDVLRTPRGRIPGWFPLVVERVHPHLNIAGVRTVVVRGSAMQVDVSEYTQRRIFYRCHEEWELAFLERILRRGDCFLDVGAHVGLFTVVGARRVDASGEVHAFEPVAGNFVALERNVRLNAFQHVKLNQAAVGDTDGTVAVGLRDPTLAGVSTGGFAIGGPYEAVDVRSLTLDSYIERHVRAERVRAIKIDAEGFESRVIGGLGATLRARPPDAIILEYNADVVAQVGACPDEIFGPLDAAGYDFFRFGASGRLVPLTQRPRQVPAAAPRRDKTFPVMRAGLAERRSLLNVVCLQPGVWPSAEPALPIRGSLRAKRRPRRQA